MKNTKGLSTVVTTLIIILLVLVAIGIIWGVVNNLLGKSSGTIEISTKCLDVNVKATKVAVSGGTETISCIDALTATGEECNDTAYLNGCTFDTCIDGVDTAEISTGDAGTYNVTLTRAPTGDDEVGAKIAFFSSTGNSEVIDFGEMLSPLETATMTLVTEDAFEGATLVKVTPYFLDSETNKQTLCPTTTEFEFE